MLESRFIGRIAEELSLRPEQVSKTVELLDGGATLPFIARYRKDVTGNLDEVKLEAVADRNAYFSALVQRRNYILDTIDKQGKLTDELRAAIEQCCDRTALEDYYLPFKKARRTKATMAREKGLQPLADFLLTQNLFNTSVDLFAGRFLDPEKGVSSPEEALDWACFILAERFSMDPPTRALVRKRMLDEGKITTHPTKNAEGKKTKFETYYDFSEPLAKIPSHRFLAVMRGVKEGVLRMELGIDDDAVMAEILGLHLKEAGSQFEPHIRQSVRDAYNRLLRPSIENEVLSLVHERADEDAIRVFRENAHNLLLSAPAGPIPVIGLDPGLRTGCKLAVIDKTGAYVESAVIFPTPPANDTEGAEKTLLELIEKHEIRAIAIGNGTGAREVSAFIRGVLAKTNGRNVFSVLVNESGASVYSASKTAREEFPELDVTVRGAISIARRLQDPLAELVKIDPRSIGVGQYQHDVNQKLLREGLRSTVVSCVNRVGVNLNTASVALLRYVSGIHADVAERIVARRAAVNGFSARQQLLEVDGVGPKVFEQCAGFLRIPESSEPLDATGIHPEAYPVVERIAAAAAVPVPELLRRPQALEGVELGQFADGVIGAHTLDDIRAELLKPGRDPRTEFKVPKFLDGVCAVADLEEGMEMEGVVTNVTDFGAFVDIGVHQDGLVHLSELTTRFVQDPREVVKVGEIVKVKVIKVDKELPRISLSMKALVPPREARSRRDRRRPQPAQADPSGAATQEQRPADRDGARPQRPRRPERGDDGRPARPARSDDRRERQPKGRNKPADRRPQQQDTSLHNTQLADQLAALRDKFSS